MSRQVVEGEPMPKGLPSLRVALEHWRASFYDESLLEERAKFLNGAQIPAGFLGFAYGFSREFGGRVAILEHEATASTAAKQQILEREANSIKNQTGLEEIPLALKTVTLAFKHQDQPIYTLVTGAGDAQIDREIKRKVAEELGLSASVAKRAEINPKDMDPQRLIRLPRGIVGPFVQKDPFMLSGVFYLVQSEPTNRLVAIAATPWETLIVEQSVCNLSVDNWHNKTTRDVPLRKIKLARN